MRTIPPTALFVLSAFLLQPGLSQSIQRYDILRWQDQRSGLDSLIIALADSRATIRSAAALALANIQDTTAVPALVGRLRDADVGVRRMSAFALGQSPCRASEQGLMSAIPTERSETVRTALLDALGRCGTAHGLDSVTTWMDSGTIDAKGGAEAFLRFSIRSIRSTRAIAQAFDLLKSAAPDIRWHALSAISRWAPNNSVDSIAGLHGGTLAVLVDDRSPDVRMSLAAMLGRISEKGSFILLQEMMAREPRRKDRDWRVQVNIARALALKGRRDLAALPSAVAMLSVRNDHVKIAALQAFEQFPPAVLRDSTVLARLFNRTIRMVDSSSAESEQVRAEAFVLLGLLNTLEYAGAESHLRSAQTSVWMKTKLLEAFGQLPTKQNVTVLLGYLDNDTVRLSTAAWDYLKRILTPPVMQALATDSAFWRPVVPMIAQRAQSSLKRGDMAVSTVVAAFVGDTAVFRWFAGIRQDEALRQALHEALAKMSSDVDVEAMQAVIGALGNVGDASSVPILRTFLEDPDRTVAVEARRSLDKLTGHADNVGRRVSVPPRHTDYDWSFLGSISARRLVEIATSKGMIEIELLPADAPFTVMSFVRLVQKRFFDGLSFHRVVPNFVVQGGDPRGDGWGGPGYAIRTEVSPVCYERGSVGVASAGKDTEGCQFFITHSATPHLDGRYTIFARVTKGMDVVDRLQIGDRIQSIRIR